MANVDLTQSTTHDLWVEARNFDLAISRPTPTSIQLTITRPIKDTVALDGAVLLLSTKTITPNEYPQDHEQYTPDLVCGSTSASMVGSAQVVAFWSNIQGIPFPVGTPSADGETTVWSVTVTGTNPNQLYYASVHGASNVLQYYPIGIQSYPLEASTVEMESSSYTGSIPSLPSAPTSPAPGFVYFDQQLKVVQYWDADRGVWIPTRTDSMLTGATNPGTPGQTYLFIGTTTLKTFNGKIWVNCDSTNLQVRDSTSAFHPMGTVSTGTKFPETPGLGDFFYDYTSQRIAYWNGMVWQAPSASNTLFQSGSVMMPAFTVPFQVEGIEIITPYAGLLFYNTSARVLNVWTGSQWIQANTDQQGNAISDKIGIGNEGTYDGRIRLIKILKSQLGWPAQCIELTEEQFNVAIDNALDTYRQLSVGAYERRFILMLMQTDQQVYYLNSPVDHTDAIVTVHKIHRLNILGANSMNWDTNVYFQTFLSQYYSSGYTDILSIHLLHTLSEEFSRIFAGDMMFTWNEARRELSVHRRISRNEKVVLEVELERSEQELLQDRWCKQFLQNWALAECKEYLGMIRSKYTSGTPGAAGTITLNGDTLLAEARQDFTELKEALLNYEYQNAEHGNVAFLMA